MEPSLSKLLEAIASPEGAKGRDVHWKQVEKELGFEFPTSFKDFIGHYGESQWFDLYSSALYPQSVDGVDEYKKSLQGVHETVDKYGIRKEEEIDGKPVQLYPESGGLLFFMSSSDGDYYFWQMCSKNPDKWPMFVWQVPGLFKLEEKTIAQLLQKTFEDFRNDQPERLWVFFTGCGEVNARGVS